MPISNSNTLPLISIVTVVFNDGVALEATIRSVAALASERVEYVVVDGGSTDGTVDIIKKYGSVVGNWTSESDLGIYDAFNKAVALAKGEWILFLGAGDLLFDIESIRKAGVVLNAAKNEVQIVYGRVVTRSLDGSFVEEENDPWELIREKWKGGRKVMPHHQGIFQRRRFLISHPFDLKYRIVADYKVFMSAVAGSPPDYIDCVIASVYVGGVSTAPARSLAAAKEIIRLNQELGLAMDHLPHQMFFVLKSIVKTSLAGVLSLRKAMQIIDGYRVATGRRKKWT